ncbi:TraR/DksA family transcriptional regulator [Nitrospira sp. NS4]|uniref:TraR/DksA family transcriptional regulator n=1 Tax=Nitrospira sp. NS4 TaxID=3414498 RepID=UPI002B9EAF13|nr:TraR/DksA C4-type zinc finger protein [Nitrospira sp.]
MKARPSAKRAPSKKSSTSARASKSTASKSSAPKTRYPDIRRALERQRANLLGEVGEVLTQHQDQEALPDVSDQASAEVNQHFSMRIREREQKLLKKIDEALDRMKVGIYGICERCGEDIPYKRLKARPVTTLCIECKTLQEQEEQARR